MTIIELSNSTDIETALDAVGESKLANKVRQAKAYQHTIASQPIVPILQRPIEVQEKLSEAAMLIDEGRECIFKNRNVKVS